MSAGAVSCRCWRQEGLRLGLGHQSSESRLARDRRQPYRRDESSGYRVRLPVQGFLLVGPEHVVVVDTGFRHPDLLERIGLRGCEEPAQTLDAQLRAYGVRFGDVRYILHTHLHLDHAGQTDKFPLTTTVVINRRELEYSVSGLSGGSYPPEDVKHLVDRLHTRGSLRLLDFDATDEHILGGIAVRRPAGNRG